MSIQTLFQPRPQPALVVPVRRAARVLLVDGHADTCELYRLWLSDHGFTVATCDTARAALERVREVCPDVIVVELMVTGDGPQLVRDIRATAQGWRALLIVLTTQSGASTRLAALEAGADAYVVKPCGAPRLSEIMASAFLERARRDDPVPR